MSDSASHLVAVCYSQGADAAVWRVRLDDQQRDQLHRTLSSLLDLGLLATFAIVAEQSCGWDQLFADLGSRLGGHTVDACLASAPSGSPTPAFVMPVWPFDHEVGGAPASTAQFLGLDLELIATPSSDEELGAYLPDRDGRWLIHARPLRI